MSGDKIDREIKGVYWPAWVFFALWGWFNLWFYASLDLWFSWLAGIVLTLGNTAWIMFAIHLKWKGRRAA